MEGSGMKEELCINNVLTKISSAGKEYLEQISEHEVEHFSSSSRARPWGGPLINDKSFHHTDSRKILNRRHKGRGRQLSCPYEKRRPAALRTLNGWNRQTEDFPMPLLFRSKSMEDLREGSNDNKSVMKEISSENMQDPGRASKLSTSEAVETKFALSPRSNSFSHSLRSDKGYYRRPPSIKTEIDSMSMRIEKLDVA